MRLSLKSIARFTRQMATYQDSFVDLRRALGSLAKGTPDGRLSKSIGRVLAGINAGDTLFEAFDKEGDRYPPIFVRMTKVGEESGTLPVIYRQLGDYFDQQLQMRRRFTMRLIYPCFMIAALVLVHALLTAVLTTLAAGEGGFGEMERLFLRTLGIDAFILAAIIATILLLRAALVGRGFTDAFILFMPPLRGPMRKLAISRFSLSMYLMTGSAIGLPEAVRESGTATNNAYFEWMAEKAAEKIEQGMPLTPALEEMGLFPAEYIDIVSVAEDSGKLSESFQRVSVHYAEDADISLNRLVSGIAWTIYAVVGGIMIFYIIRIFAGYVGAINQFSTGY